MNFDEERFDGAIKILASSLKKRLNNLSPVIKNDTYEIRMRSSKPIVLYGRNGCVFLSQYEGVTTDKSQALICDPEEISDTFNRLCCYSVYSHIESIVKGYITYQGGHRAGITGTASYDKGNNVTCVNNISAINIRIAREVTGAGDYIMNEIFSDGLKSIIIAGPPSSGKTTVLRDVVRQLSDRLYKVSLIDERREIASMNGGIAQNDVGINTDVYDAYPKETAIMNALKTMSPDLIALDEIGCDEEIDGVRLGIGSGVNFITTLHALTKADLLARPQLHKMLETKGFDYVVLLSKDFSAERTQIFTAKEIYFEIFGRTASLDKFYAYRDTDIITA